jgi:hypothetical protein
VQHDGRIVILRLAVSGLLAGGLVLTLGLGGVFASTVPGTASPNPEVLEQVVAERFTPQLSIVDQVFLRTVRSGAPSLGQNADANLIEAGRSVCRSLDTGSTLGGLSAAYVQSGFDRTESSWFFGVSVGAYCSRHANKITG